MLISRVIGFRGKSQSDQISGRRLRARRAVHKPCLEGLEERTLLATFATGDVFISNGSGQVEWHHGDGTLVKVLDTGLSGTRGSAFDSVGNLYVANFAASNVSEFDTTGHLLGTFGGGYQGSPESIVFDAAGDAYVGQVDGSAQVLKFNSSGALFDSYSPQVEQRGTDWIELAADQHTLFYTSEGFSVKRFDLSTKTQLTDFATGFKGLAAFALRILPTGGMLVADSEHVLRLDSSGNIVQTYTASGGDADLFALNLDPDGKSFWTGDLLSGNVYKFDIASGTQLQMIPSTSGNGIKGLSVFGEIDVSHSSLNVTAPPNQAATAGVSTSYNLGSFSDSDSTATSWSLDINWGDNSAHTKFNTTTQGSLGSQAHVYTTNGSYPVTVTVMSNAGNTGSGTFQVAVGSATGILVTSPGNQTVTQGSAIALKLGSFSDPNAVAKSWSVDVNWGDNTAHTTFTTTAQGPIASQAHVFGNTGSYTVTVTVTNNVGNSASGSFQVTVNGVTTGGQIVWSGASGVDLNWSDPNNWFGKVVPGPADTAVFNDKANNRNSTVDPAYAGTVGGLILDSSWGSALNLQTALTVLGNSTWASGTIDAARVGLNNAGTLTLGGKDNKYLDGLLTNNGTIVQGAGGGFGIDGDGTLANNGTYDFQADGTGIFIGFGPTATFINRGTVKKSAVTNANDRSFLHVNYFINQGGSFDVETGRLALGEAQIDSTGMSIIVAGADAVLDLTDNSGITYTGSFGNATGNGHVRLSSNNLYVGQSGATFNFAAGLFEWNGGNIVGGVTGFTNNGFVTVTGSTNKGLDGLFTNNGTIIQRAGGGLGINGDAILTNNGTYDFQADGTGIFIGFGPTATFINRGTVKKSAVTNANDRSFLHVDYLYNLGGTFDVETGRLALGQAQVNSTDTTIIVAAADAVLDLTDNTGITYSGNYGNASGNGHVRLINNNLYAGLTGATFNFASGLFEWTGGNILGGVTGLTNNGFMTLTGSDNKDLNGLLTNNGTMMQRAGGGFGINGDAMLANNGTYDFQADATGIFIASGTTGTFINRGTVKKSVVTNPNDRSFLHVNYLTNLGGTFDVETGRLALGQAQVESTSITILVAAADAVLDLTDNSGITYSGNYGNASGNGHVRLINNNLYVGEGGATFNFASGLFEWTAGNILGGVTGLTNNGFMSLTTSNNKDLNGLLTNNGSVLHVGGGFGINGDATLANNGTYDFQADNIGIFIASGPISTFQNTGVVKKSAGSNAASLSVSLFNNQSSGVVDVESGTLNFNSGGSSIGNFNAASGAAVNFNGGTYWINSGTTFTGAGLMQLGNGTVVINGSASAQNVALVSGTLKLNTNAIFTVGSYQQTGTLAFDLAGTTPGVGVGQMAITGTAKLGGTLNIALINNYFPNAGDQFQILTFGSHIGNFGGTSGLNLGNGVTLSPMLTDTTFALVAKASPAPPPGPGGAFPGKGPMGIPSLPILGTPGSRMVHSLTLPVSNMPGQRLAMLRQADAFFEVFGEEPNILRKGR